MLLIYLTLSQIICIPIAFARTFVYENANACSPTNTALSMAISICAKRCNGAWL